jgi:hypothetical protein
MPVIGLPPEVLVQNYAAQLEHAEATFLADRRAWAQERFAQSREVVRRCSWRTRTLEWEAFLARAIAAKRR